jgi:ERCC4-type nuclease
MSEITPTILVDTREQNPLDIQAYPVEVATLPAGDYGVKGFSDWNNPRFSVERKSLNDLVGSLTGERERFMRECQLLRRFQFAVIVVEAVEAEVSRQEYRSLATPQSILASLAAIQVRYGIHIVWAGDHDGAARTVETLVRQFVRGIEKDHKALRAAVPAEAAI